jgi:hypothetical protein
MLLVGAATATVPATAVPFVTSGSSYTFYIQGEQSGNPLSATTTFDGVAEFAQRDGLTLTVNESEEALGNGLSRITFNLMANGSLFSIADEGIIFGIGTDPNMDGFDFNSNVDLLSATITLLDINGGVFDITSGLEQFVDQNMPWNGLFLGPNNNVGLGGVDATQVAGIRAEFVVGGRTTDVPEPDSILLCGIGLLAGFTALHRRRS